VRRADSWASAPVARLLIPFCLGITWILFTPNPRLLLLIVIAALGFAGYIISHLFFNKLGYGFRFLPGCFLFVALFFCGSSLTLLSRADLQPGYFYPHTGPGTVMAVRLTEPLQEKEKSYKALGEVEGVYNGAEAKAVTGKVLLYFQKKGITNKPAYGDVLLIRNKLQHLESPRNPGEFDYATYMANKQVFYSCWLQAGDWKATGENRGNPVWKVILGYRARLAREIEGRIQNEEERGIAKAILLGEDKELDPHVRAAYTGTGTLHVLSVSGMHVGILFIVLRFLLAFLLQNRAGRIVRMLLLLSFLWGYALLTGLSPSVARSAAMLSLVLIGLDYKRSTNTYNVIAASAFGLLLIDPYLLTQVSFQLSYAAILGIVWLQPQIAKHWHPKGWILKNGWEIIAASIAAQITTFPLGLYYFNQFPLYFLLSNLIIIPLSTLTLFVGSAWLALAPIPFLGYVSLVLGFVTDIFIRGMNWCASFLSGFPSATIDGLYIPVPGFILLCFSIILIAFSIQQRRRRVFLTGAICSVLFFCSQLYARHTALEETRLTVHSIDKTAAISIKEDDKLYLIGDTALFQDADARKYHFQGFVNSLYIHADNVIPVSCAGGLCTKGQSFYYQSPFGQFEDHKFLWLHDKKELQRLPQGLVFDFVVLSGNISTKIKELKEKIGFNKLIITADNSGYHAKHWEDDCRGLGIACVNLKKDYSYIVSN
jgi:competence protein ComEC